MKTIMTESPSKSASPHKASSTRRRINKPLMERKRRARINESLNELKTLVLAGMKKDPARYNRLEKADILEMTVSHLKTLQRQQIHDSLKKSPEIVSKYQLGFSKCASEVTSYLSRSRDLDPELRSKIRAHLLRCEQRLNDGVAAVTTNVESSATDLFKRQRLDSDSNSSDEENSPAQRTHCAANKQQKEQQSEELPLHCANQCFAPGLVQLPTGVQVVLIPKDLLLKSNTCVQDLSSECTRSKDVDGVASGRDSLNLSSGSSDLEPDSTMLCDTTLEVQVTASSVVNNASAVNSTPRTSSSGGGRSGGGGGGGGAPQEQALDLSAPRSDDQDDSMWRPW